MYTCVSTIPKSETLLSRASSCSSTTFGISRGSKFSRPQTETANSNADKFRPNLYFSSFFQLREGAVNTSSEQTSSSSPPMAYLSDGCPQLGAHGTVYFQLGHVLFCLYVCFISPGEQQSNPSCSSTSTALI